MGYATVALSGNELGLIGSIIGGVATIMAAVMANAAASRRQKREVRYQRRGSGMTGFLLALLLVSIAAGVYFANRPTKKVALDIEAPVVQTTVTTIAPTALPTTAPTTSRPAAPSTPTAAEAPITLEEASAFVASYLQVRPGLTGEWQVTHRSSGIHLIHCFDEDMHYVSRINLVRDLGIILRTFGVVLGAKGI